MKKHSKVLGHIRLEELPESNGYAEKERCQKVYFLTPIPFLLYNTLNMFIFSLLVHLNSHVYILRALEWVCLIYGYNRISTSQQHLERGEKSINDFCLSRNYDLKSIYQDKISGKNFSRPRYTVLKEDVLRDGDILIVPELDRLGRNKAAIVEELKYFKENNIRVIFLDIPTTAVDTTSLPDELSKLLIDTVNSILIELCAVQAESEYTRSKKRQAEGIVAKKSAVSGRTTADLALCHYLSLQSSIIVFYLKKYVRFS